MHTNYDRLSRTLEMRACRLAIIEALYRVGALEDLPTTEISNIAKRACERASGRRVYG